MTVTSKGTALSKAVGLVLLLLASVRPACASIYEVGPGQKYVNLGDVPWFKLTAGDTVNIHYRPTPYSEKILISGRGTAAQWIRVIGIPGPNGELPVISGKGATTSKNMHYRWQDATGGSAIQWDGVIQIAVRADDPTGPAPMPAYIEIAGLQVQDGYKDNSFVAENGVTANYDGFAACIYARSVQHILIRNNVLSGCGQGFYNWTGSGTQFWDGLEADTVLRGNYFVNNGNPGSYTEHQSYTESDGVVIEYNRYGVMRTGALGSQLKDRSAGTIVRYNYVESAPSGWMMDLVEPQESFAAIGGKATYAQTFVYGNVMVNRGSSNVVHWNEDHQVGNGRATVAGGTLFFYHNTVVTIADTAVNPISLFNTTYGAYDCPPTAPPGIIDARNNIFAALPRTPGASPVKLKFAYCQSQNFTFGRNWVSAGWTLGTTGTVVGVANLVVPAVNDPKFVDAASGELHLVAGSTAIAAGGALAPQVTSNALGLDLSPTRQYVYQQQVGLRPARATPDLGAFSFPTVTAPVVQVSTPANLRFVR